MLICRPLLSTHLNFPCLPAQALPLTSADRFDARPPWMVGTPQLLTPDDTSPFYELAPIPPGEMQYAVDTPCFRCARLLPCMYTHVPTQLISLSVSQSVSQDA